MSSGGGLGGGMTARVPIPSNLRNTIQDIKEIAAGKHSDDDIYAMLKECNMDPNETAQRLLYLDTFHEVKRKRDKKKVDVGQGSDEYRRAYGIQRRGARLGRESCSASNALEDFGGQRKVSYRQENGLKNHSERSSRPSAAVVLNRENIAGPSVSSSSTDMDKGPKNLSNGASYDETASQVSFDTDRDDIKSAAVYGANISGVYSKVDPVSVPPLNLRGPDAVGSIKCEDGTLWNFDTESISIQSKGGMIDGRDMEKNGPGASGIMNSSGIAAPGIPHETNLYPLPEAPCGLSSTICSRAIGFQTNHDDGPAQQVYSPATVVESQAENAVPQSNITSLSNWNDATVDQMTPELDRQLEKLSVSTHQPVIFPDHLHVPEALRKGLTFGSLDATLGQNANCENVFVPMTENCSATDLAGSEASQSNQSASSANKGNENANQAPSHSQFIETSPSLGDDASSDEAQKFDPQKQEMLVLQGGSQYPFLQTAPDYSFGNMPFVLAPHIMHLEGAEPQAVNPIAPSTSASTPQVTALPPQLLPFLRQPYPSNFIPYNPYFPHLYMPHNTHHFLGHGVLPHQPTAGNMYVPPGAAGGSTKYAVPPIFKTATVVGNMAHFGIPSGYGPYGASSVGYNSSPAFTSGSSGVNEDLLASELKEKNMYTSALKQKEESHAWSSQPGCDLSTLTTNYFYNIPPGQHLSFSPAHSSHGPFPGVYHLSHAAHPLPPQLPVQSLSQQSQVTVGPVEFVVSTSQQPHAQMNWNNRLLNKENI